MAGKGRPFGKGEGGRPKGVPNKSTAAIRDSARALVEDPDYVASLKVRLLEGRAGQIEPLLYHYAYGKPKETIAVEGEIPPFILRIQGDDEPSDDGQ